MCVAATTARAATAEAYRLKLAEGKSKGTEVFAPIDHEQFVRAGKFEN